MITTNPKFFEFSKHLLTRFISDLGIDSTKHLCSLALDFDIQPGVDYTDFKTLYDIAEFSMNSLIDYRLKDYHSLDLVNSLIQNSLQLLCSETERSVSQAVYQQFSTPLHISWMMHLLARINQDSIILEPSAGTGTLLSFRRFFNPKITVANEISPLRFSLLQKSGIDYCYNENAEMIHFMPKFINHGINTILMNPPFSRSILTGNKVDILAGSKHLIAAYNLLSPGGRLVLLINDSFKESTKPWKYFLSKVSNIHIPVNASIDPKAFKSKGTLYPTRVLVIVKSDTSQPLYTEETIDLERSINYLKSL